MRKALWNANGLGQHKFELELFLKQQQIDVMLISETHFTDKNYLKIQVYNFYHTQHPSGKAHGGTGIIIKSSIKHYELPSFQKFYLQATSVAVENYHGTITTSAIYCPPRHSIAKENFDSFLDALSNRFIAGGDNNAKHTQWGSRLVTARGKNILKSITTNNLNYPTTYEPTYWPTDTKKIPDLLDFFITKNISPRYVQINSSAELSSDHSPVIARVNSAIIENPPNGLIHNQLTNWQLFTEVFNHSTSASISLKTKEDIETATEYLNSSIINAISSSTPTKTSISKHEYLHYILNKITEKRRLTRVWQTHRIPDDKRKLNHATRKLTKIIKKYKNDCFQKYLVNLSSTADSNYSLWRAFRKLTRPPQIIPPIRYLQGGLARSPIEKTNLFANYLSNVFKSHSSNTAPEITEYLHSPFQMSPPPPLNLSLL